MGQIDTDSDCLGRAHLEIFPPPPLAAAFRTTFRPIPMPLGRFLTPTLFKRLRYVCYVTDSRCGVKIKRHILWPNYPTPVVSNYFLVNLSGKLVRRQTEPRDFPLG